MFRKLLFICLWLCVLSGTAATGDAPRSAPPFEAPARVAAP
jgi:hypothetical protein